jgi:hypothetical protein
MLQSAALQGLGRDRKGQEDSRQQRLTFEQVNTFVVIVATLKTPLSTNLAVRSEHATINRAKHAGACVETNTVLQRNEECLRKDPETNSSCFLLWSGRKRIGRREWTRTIDPHHVKVVL